MSKDEKPKPSTPEASKHKDVLMGEERYLEEVANGLDDKLRAAHAERLQAMENRFLELANKIMVDRPKPMIYSKMIAIMKDVEAIDKDKLNKEGGNFKYRGIDDVYNELHQLMAKHGVISVPTLVKSHWTERKTSTGKIMFHATCVYKYTFYAEDGSHLTAEVETEGQDTADKLTGKALSYAHKPVLLQVFMIPTKDLTDPDAQKPEDSYDQRPRPQQRPPQQNKPAPQKPPAQKPPAQKPAPPATPGDFVIDFTKGFKGKKISELKPDDLRNLLDWCIDNKAKEEFQKYAIEFLDSLPPEPTQDELNYGTGSDDNVIPFDDPNEPNF